MTNTITPPHLGRAGDQSTMIAVPVPSSSGNTTHTVYVHHGKVVGCSWAAPAVGARITLANSVNTCRPHKPNLTNPPACIVGAGLVVPSCVEGVHGSGHVCEGARRRASSSG
jgi:hypothetical protein